MTITKKIIRWWLDGWKILFFYAALYIGVTICLTVPVLLLEYFWNPKEFSTTSRVFLVVAYVGIYLPLIVKAIDVYLGKKTS